MSFDITTSQADTITSKSLNIPIARMSGNTMQIIELLRIDIEFSKFSNGNNDERMTNLSLFNFETVEATLGSPAVFFKHSDTQSISTNGAFNKNKVFTKNYMVDNHGYLIAADTMFVQIDVSDTGGNLSCDYKFWYRFVPVSTQDYAKIIQQQSSIN